MLTANGFSGATYIDWQWLPPVIDGGLAVTDYEIAYTGRHTLFDKSIGRYQHWETEDSLLTSRFCFQHNAIAHTGYRLNGLRAGSEYTHFKVRCCNLRGWSDWVEMLQDEEDPMQKMLREQQKNAASGSDGVFALEMQSPKKDVMSLAEGKCVLIFTILFLTLSTLHLFPLVKSYFLLYVCHDEQVRRQQTAEQKPS